MTSETVKPALLTMGEPGGVGPELALMAWSDRAARALPPFAVCTDPALMTARAARLDLDVPVRVVETAEEAAEVFDTALPVIDLEQPIADAPGEATPATAGAVIASIRRAVGLVLADRFSAVVTNPIQKSALYAADFPFPGHTEFLAALADTSGLPPRPVMMLAAPQLRVVPVTIHVPLADVPSLLTESLIVETGMIVARELMSRGGVYGPRLAISGLNPHAGEGGTMGDEEERIIRPAVARLKAQGVDAVGPLSADTLFHAEARAGYDAALMMYHDQALIPIKTLAFDEAVNVTLGLPFIRTSPDHGTALDIAGTGAARPDSLCAAIRMAYEMKAFESDDHEIVHALAG
ncbi:MAG: 4-hydroxythreonine-4-phosphate dehydrogenase PdxA [Pseudomonadota bacterium]